MSFSSSFSVQPVAIASSRPIHIRIVTRHNFRVEFSAINYLINATRYNKVSFDTEYPGQLFHSDPKQSLHPAAAYSLMKANVDDLKLIQVGLVVSDAEGNLPHFNTNFVYVWEFLLSDFDVDNDEGDNDSIGLLMRQGVDFEFNLREGINRRDFVTMLMWSGLVGRGNSRVTWITFNGAHQKPYVTTVRIDQITGGDVVQRDSAEVHGVSNYSSMEGVLYCKTHFEQVSKKFSDLMSWYATLQLHPFYGTKQCFPSWTFCLYFFCLQGRAPSKLSAMFGTQDKCSVCKKTVYPLEKVTVEGEFYHKGCFRCSHGGCNLNPSSYAALDGILYCKPHFNQLFREKGSYTHLTKTASLKKNAAAAVAEAAAATSAPEHTAEEPINAAE
ncbi:hypothetical protein QQ045_010248 [Rhodiola kirilowii]